MSATGTTYPEDNSSYVYGGVIYQRVIEPDFTSPAPHTGLGACLAQGISVGAVLVFLFTLAAVLLWPRNVYNFYFILFFPLSLCYGLVAGFVQALVMWVCIRLAGHNLRWFTRMLISALVFAIADAVILATFRFPRHQDLTSYLLPMGIAAALGALFGLVTGSNLKLLRELVRGEDLLPSRARFLTGSTGLVLRVAVVIFLMQSILAVIVLLQVNFQESELLLELVLLVHFIAALAVTFARVKFWILLPLAVIINGPILLNLNHLNDAHVVYTYLCFGYLSAWAAYLVARFQFTYKALAVVNEELRYYLLD